MVPASVGVAVALLAISATSSISAAYASKPANPPRPITWLAAGDSYSSGQGLSYRQGICARAYPSKSQLGAWGPQAAEWLSKAHQHSAPVITLAEAPDLVACTGARIAEFRHTQQTHPAVGPAVAHPAEWNPSMGRYDLVSFTFGGNNVHFASVIQDCIGVSLGTLAETLATGGLAELQAWKHNPRVDCPSNSSLRRLIAHELAGPNSPYGRFLASVARQAVTPGGNIVVLGYPEIVETPKLWPIVDRVLGMCEGIRAADAYELRGLAGDLNATIAQTVKDVNADSKALHGVHLTYIDVNTGTPSLHIPYSDPNLFEPDKGPRHNLCASQEWLNGITLFSKHFSVNASFHPKQQGNNAMAHLVEQVFPYLDWSQLVNPHPIPGQPSAPQTTVPSYTVGLATIAANQGGSIQDSYNGSSFSYAVSTSDDSQSDALCGCTPPVSPATETLASMRSTSCSSISLQIFAPWNPADTGGEDEVSLVQPGEPTPTATVTTNKIEANLDATLTGGPWSLDVTETAPAADGNQATVYVAGTLSCSTPDGTVNSSNSPAASSTTSPGTSPGGSTGGVSIASAPVLVPGRTYAVDLSDEPTAQLAAPGETQEGGICPMWAGQWWKLNLQAGDVVSVSWSYSEPASGFYQYLVFPPSATDQDVLDQANNGEQLQFINSDTTSASGSFTAPVTGSYPFIIGDGCPSTSGPFHFAVQISPGN